MNTSRLFWWTGGLVLAVAALSPAGRAVGDLTTLGVAGRANAHVSLASEGPVVIAAWAASAPGGETDIMSAVSRDAGRTFSAPVRVNHIRGDARVNGEQPPRAVLVKGTGAVPRVTIVWTANGANGTRLQWASSVDGGRTFTPARPVADTDAPGNRGWEALAAGPGGRVFTAWLDHRKLASGGAMPAGHQHGAAPSGAPAAADGAGMAELSQLYVGAVDGTGAAVPVTGGVCYCCKTALVSGANDTVFVAWRHVYPGNMRDIAFSVSRDGARTFQSPVRVSEDRWQIAGCPDDGPAMALDPQGQIHIVWPSVVTEQGGPVKTIFHAVSRDGTTFAARARVPTQGQAHHPQFSIHAAGEAVLVWDESGTGTRQVVAARARTDPSGRLVFLRLPGSLGAGSYPAVAAAGPDGWLVAWTSGAGGAAEIKLHRIPRSGPAS